VTGHAVTARGRIVVFVAEECWTFLQQHASQALPPALTFGRTRPPAAEPRYALELTPDEATDLLRWLRSMRDALLPADDRYRICGLCIERLVEALERPGPPPEV
jgi:hypothetical protein